MESWSVDRCRRESLLPERTVKKVAKHMDEVTGRRIVMKVVGTDVAHAHVHLTPMSETWEYGKTLKLREDEFLEIQQKLAF